MARAQASQASAARRRRPPQPRRRRLPTTAKAATSTAEATVAAAPDAKPESAAEETTEVAENDVFKATFTNRGAVLKSFILKHYTDEQKQPLELVRTSRPDLPATPRPGLRQGLRDDEGRRLGPLRRRTRLAARPALPLHGFESVGGEGIPGRRRVPLHDERSRSPDRRFPSCSAPVCAIRQSPRRPRATSCRLPPSCPRPTG
jgi:hypothetical protein